MIKKIRYLFFATISGILILVTIKLFGGISHKEATSAVGVKMPEFNFSTMQNKPFTKKDAEGENRVIIGLFDPDCDHCQSMMKMIVAKKEQLKNVKVLMITWADSLSAQKFIKAYKLNQLNNLTILRDKKIQFYNLFGTSIVPSFFIYENGILIKKYTGETTFKNLLVNN